MRLTSTAIWQDETLEYAGTLPGGTFGHAYAQFMGRRRRAHTSLLEGWPEQLVPYLLA